MDEFSKLGVSAVTLKKLKQIGVESIEDLLMFNPEELSERAGISEETAFKIIRNARHLVKRRRVYSALELKKQGRCFFTTGCKALDDLLGGGIEVRAITEFVGEFGSGKTQICHQLCVTVQLPKEQGGLEGKAVFIDTEETFAYERIESIAKRFNINPEFILKNIYVLKTATVDELEHVIIEELPSILKEGIRLIVVDSIIALYRAEFKGRGMLAARQQRLNYLIDWLKRYMRNYSLAVVYTNQVLQSASGFLVMKLPAGGNILAHAATHRVYLRRLKDCCEAEVFDSPRLPKRKAVYKITERGIEDV